jgi:hypothetical protein
VAAISVDLSAIDLIKFVDFNLEKFHIPIHTTAQYGMTTIMQWAQGYRLRWDKRLLMIHENLHLFLTPVRKRVVVETLVVETHCTSTEEEFDEIVTIVGSNGTQLRWKSDEFDDYGKRLVHRSFSDCRTCQLIIRLEFFHVDVNVRRIGKLREL